MWMAESEVSRRRPAEGVAGCDAPRAAKMREGAEREPRGSCQRVTAGAARPSCIFVYPRRRQTADVIVSPPADCSRVDRPPKPDQQNDWEESKCVNFTMPELFASFSDTQLVDSSP